MSLESKRISAFAEDIYEKVCASMYSNWSTLSDHTLVPTLKKAAEFSVKAAACFYSQDTETIIKQVKEKL